MGARARGCLPPSAWRYLGVGEGLTGGTGSRPRGAVIETRRVASCAAGVGQEPFSDGKLILSPEVGGFPE